MINEKMTKMKAFGIIVPALLIAVAMAIGAAALLAPANETDAAYDNVTYLDVDGDPQPAYVVVLTSAADFSTIPYDFNLSDTMDPTGVNWFYVKNDISLGPMSILHIWGTVNIIIGAECTLSYTNAISVHSGATLSIYTEEPLSVGKTGIGKVSSGSTGVILTTGSGPFVNTAWISSGRGIDIGFSTASFDITNGVTGTIEATQDFGINLTPGGSITNKGLIKGGPSYIATMYPYGIFAYGSVSLNNTGKITGWGGVHIQNYDASDTFENHGEIIGTSGYGVRIDNGTGIVITNDGTIESLAATGQGLSIADGTGIVINNDAAGQIKGGDRGIQIGAATGTINNYGIIKGGATGYGVYAANSATVLNDGNGDETGATPGIIMGDTGVYIGHFVGGVGGDVFTNYGRIEGTAGYGVTFFLSGTDELITNGIGPTGNVGKIIADGESAVDFGGSGKVVNTGLIQSNNGHGIYINRTGKVENDGNGMTDKGVIIGFCGVWIQGNTGGSGANVITNSGRIEGTVGDGINIQGIDNNIIINSSAPFVGKIIGAAGGVNINNKGSVTNHGIITGGTTDGVNISNQAVFLNNGTVNGNVTLGNYNNTVTFWAGSTITGNFTMGTAFSILHFRQTPTGIPLKYATVLGTVNIGNVAVTLEDIPAAYTGGMIILIDSSTSVTSSLGYYVGSWTTTTAVSEVFQIFAVNKQLLATQVLLNVPYLDVDGNSGTHNAIEINQTYFGASGVAGTLTDIPGLTGTDGTWYCVTGDINLSGLTTVGDVSIIIGNNKTLTSVNGVSVTAGEPLGLYSQPLAAGDVMGELRSTANNIHAVNLNGSTLLNTASILATGTAAYGVRVQTNAGSVTNNGKIEGISTAVTVSIFNNADGVISSALSYCVYITSFNGAVSTFNNDGIIRSTGGTAVYFVHGTDAEITNYGTIEGISVGVNMNIDPGSNGEVNNYGTISGTSSYGVHLIGDSNFTVNNYKVGADIGQINGNYGIYFTTATIPVSGKVYNEGYIEGTGYGIMATHSVSIDNQAGDGATYGVITGNNGIYVENFVGGAGGDTIDNYGLIEGTGGDAVLVNGNDILITNYATGEILALTSGAAVVLLGDGKLDNSGYIEGIEWGVITVKTAEIENAFGATILGGDFGIAAHDNIKITNSGDIEGTVQCGIWVKDAINVPRGNIVNNDTGTITGGVGIWVAWLDESLGYTITNHGEITGTAGDGIDVNNGDGILVTNEGGSITGMDNGIVINGAYGTIYNNVVGANVGSINGTSVDGVCLYQGGEVYNYGSITGGQCGIYADNDSLCVVNDGDGVAGGIIEGTNEWGVCTEDAVYINNIGGLITGNGGIYAAWLDQVNGFTITNTGTIEATGSHGIYVEDGDIIDIYNDGLIDADKCGIYVVTGSETYICNDTNGEIEDGDVGICVQYSDYTTIENYGTVTSAFDGIDVNDGIEITILNYGTVESTGVFWFGILVANGGYISIYNGGEVIADYAVIVWDSGNSIYVTNDGTIDASAGVTGVYVLFGIVENNGTILAGEYGVVLDFGGELYNNPGAEISSGDYAVWIERGGPALLENWGLLTGDVIFSDDPNTVTLGAGSMIDGDFYIGTDPATTLTFVGVLDPTLTYAVITGDSDIGNKTAEVWFDRAGAGLPAYFPIGEKIILIDGSAGSIVTAPANSFLLDGYIYFKIYVKNDQLIAERARPDINYYITATADSNTTISPAGVVTAAWGTNATFTFSAAAGSFIGSVAVDGVYLSQADIDKGYYTFNDVKANHTIKVESRGSRTGISLTVTVAEGKGFAEYSVNGGNFAKYTSSVPLPEGSNVTLRPVAANGFEFVEWREGGTIMPLAEVSFNNISSSVDVSVSFSGSDSSRILSNNLLLFAIILILILLVVIVIVFLLKRRSKATA